MKHLHGNADAFITLSEDIIDLSMLTKESRMTTYYEAINWNAIEDMIDKSTWEKAN